MHNSARLIWIHRTREFKGKPILQIRAFGTALATVFVWLAPEARASDFHVSPRGSDINTGNASKPFATLERARQAVRESRQTRNSSGSLATVTLLGGDYLRTNGFELTSADSGDGAAPVIWRAAEGQRVRFLGGRSLSGFVPVTNADALARLPQGAHSHVLQVNLRSLGISDFGQMKSRGFARDTAPAHCELFYAGKPMTLARWPNEGDWEHIAGFPVAQAQNDGHNGDIGKLEAGFLYSGERPRQWQDITNVWVHGYWAWDWANSYERIASIDLTQHLIRTAPPYGNYGFRKGQRICFINVLEELDQPGEWFLDAKSGFLYFWPPADVQKIDSKPPEILLSTLAAPFLKLNNVTNVIFNDIEFEAARGNAVEFHGGASNRIVNCSIRNMGDWGVVADGGFGHGVENCTFDNTGDGGVSLKGGDRQKLIPAGDYVENCRFSHQGRWSKCYVPAVLMEGVGLRVSRNLIHDHPHCAILFTGNDHVIELNEIHHIALETGDVGAIYSGRDYTYRGNRIRYNFIHHTGGVGMGSMGIYMDDCVSGTEIYGNIFYKVQRAAFLGGGRDHQVLNNVFVECNHAVELDGRGLDASPTWREMVYKFMRQRLDEVPSDLYRERYPAIKTLDHYYGGPGEKPIEGAAFTGVPPENNIVARNLCVGKWLNVYWHATPNMLKLENNLTDVDPLFAKMPTDNSTVKDFALKPDSPAWKMGFQKIPVEQIGPK
jgi:hypothetical protein